MRQGRRIDMLTLWCGGRGSRTAGPVRGKSALRFHDNRDASFADAKSHCIDLQRYASVKELLPIDHNSLVV